MRVVISIAALLMMLALAAFGIISAEKVSAGSQTTASVSSAAAGSQTASTASRRFPVNPVSQLYTRRERIFVEFIDLSSKARGLKGAECRLSASRSSS